MLCLIDGLYCFLRCYLYGPSLNATASIIKMRRNIKYGLIVGMFFIKFGSLTSTVDIVDPRIPIPDRY